MIHMIAAAVYILMMQARGTDAAVPIAAYSNKEDCELVAKAIGLPAISQNPDVEWHCADGVQKHELPDGD